MGYKGTKVGLFVLSEDKVSSDTNNPDGVSKYRMRLLEKAHQGELKAAAIAVPKVVHYDLAGLKITLNEHFKFIKEIEA